jgi:formylglycine-generating enzyme required for sulfatase activity
MGSNPSHFSACDRNWLGAPVGNGNDCPVESVSWDDAQEFARRLSQRTGQNYRLPSEAEWEYAARAGSQTAYHWGDQIGTGNANCGSCGSRWDGKGTAPVGKFAPNALGLHDMHGNVLEWVRDVWHGDYSGAPGSGAAWTTGGDQSRRVLRGGSWHGSPENLRSASRVRGTPGFRDIGVGFRIARTP